MLRPMLLVSALAALAALGAGEQEGALKEFAHLPHRHQTVRPVASFGDQLKTTVGLSLIDVDVEERRNAATLSGWLSLRWRNPALARAAAGAVNHTRVRPEDIWVPDVLPYDSLLPAGQGWLRETLAVVYSDGQTLWVPPCTMQVRCRRQLTEHKDRYTCRLRLGSWTYSLQEMDLVVESDAVDTSEFIANGRWAVESSRIKRDVKKYDCCPEKYVMLDIELVLKPQLA